MKRICLVFAVFFALGEISAQVDTSVVSGVEVIVSKKTRNIRTNFYFSGGLQGKTWYAVPMVSENTDPAILRNGNELPATGWFAGIGASKPTSLHLEIGIMLNYYSSSVPVAVAGERSTSDWILDMTGSYFTEPYTYGINRINNVFSVRTFLRYNINFRPFNYWVAVHAGTYSSTITYKGEGQESYEGTYNHTSLGVNGQTGLDFLIRDSMGRDKVSLTIFAEFISPRISESVFNLFQTNWLYYSENNYAIAPLRFGAMIGIH